MCVYVCVCVFNLFIADATSEYSRLKDEYKKMEQDYSHISRIMTIAASLQQDYTVRGGVSYRGHRVHSGGPEKGEFGS